MNIFWRKFAKFLLLGLSVMVIVVLAQQTMIGDFSRRGPDVALALDEGGFEEPGFGGGTEPIEEPVPEAPAASVQPAAPAPSCSDDLRYCDSNVGKTIHKTGGYWDGSQCVYAFVQEEACGQQSAPSAPAAPPAQGAPAAPVNNACYIGKACTCSGSSAGSCNQCDGGWCNGGQCSSCSASAPVQQPNAPSCPADIKMCPNGSAVSRNPGAGCNFYACPNVVVAPTVTTCSPYSNLVTECVGQQRCSFNNIKNADCSTSRNGPYNCSYIQGYCGYNPGNTSNSCTGRTTQESECVGIQLCTRDVTRRSDCSTSRGGYYNCRNSAQCGYTSPVTPTAPPAQGAPAAPIVITNTNNPVNTNTVTVNNPAREVVREIQTFRNVGVGTSAPRPVYYAGVKQLPNTGLPLLAWAAAAFIPAGFGMRRFKKVNKKLAEDPNYLWENRQYHRV